MGSRDELRALEAMTPWLRADFQAGLAALRASTAEEARRFAADMRALAVLTAMVPRCDGDDRGGTPWTSFRREIAVARTLSDQAAATEIRAAVRLTSCLPRTLELLEAGTLSHPRARAFLRELEVYDDELAAVLDAELADRAATVPPWRIARDVHRAALLADPDAAALRSAAKTADRGVLLHPDDDDQASVVLFGPAVPLTRWHSTLDTRARALRAAGDPRTLDNLRFDLATSTFPCTTHPPASHTPASHTPASPTPAARPSQHPAPPPPASGPNEPTGLDGLSDSSAAPADLIALAGLTGLAELVEMTAAGLRPSGVEPASTDCRRTRPVQALITVPVETALGLSNEPGWLDGYGWISAPTTRQLLVDAELRRACAQTSTGALVDLTDRQQRPPPTPDGIRDALIEMVLHDTELHDLGWRTEADHDPSEPLRDYVTLRDRTCDGPSGTRTSARRCELDHDSPHPDGPTAAWNLAARASRTHQLKHYGWTPLRTATGTTWISPAGQTIHTPRHTQPPPGIDPGPASGAHASHSDDHPQSRLPDPRLLAETDQHQLTPADLDDLPPWLPTSERHNPTTWTWLDDTALQADTAVPANLAARPETDEPPF